MNALAVMLLMGPGEIPVSGLDECEQFELTEKIKEEAKRLGIVDERELSSFFVREDEFESDLDILRRRWDDLKDSPPIEFFDQFPSQEWCRVQCDLNRNIRCWLESESLIHPHRAFVFWSAMQENNVLYQFWANLRDAKNDSYYLSSRRAAGKRAMDVLERTGYSLSHLPPAIPVWRWEAK